MFFIGCGQKIYEKKYSAPSKHITCLKLQTSNPLTKYYIEKLYNFSQNCPFILRTTSHFVSSCSSAKAKALGSDFDGFLRLELFENGRLLYRNQADFKGCLRQDLVKRLFMRMRKVQKF
ncbi:hypothetical protein [Nitratiruptor sp. YY09-18]|uniref:hypothetical protein n=1 Tax=Nitratiruptor sp. YY09-18 TaxID=2724901 RepID=UPI0019158521|nr:hypothetical protein [Nitratiruptor sp. YY09-18]BCD67291.1 hypothetical protein NitYY0918_C0167 [Nitratiruptor sp. YY09-18]